MGRRGSAWCALLLSSWLLLCALATSCKKSTTESQNPVASAAANASIIVNAMRDDNRSSANRPKYVPQPAASMIPIPTGPRLAILSGQGVGPIRIGATVQTIERHMSLPCELLTNELCRYFARAVDFHLKNGVVERVVVHRRDRAAGKDKRGKERVFGIFNGGIPPDFEVMMKQHVVMEHLGPPLKRESVKAPNQFDTVERHHYEGLVAEYDRYHNGQIVLGGVHIEKPTTGSKL